MAKRLTALVLLSLMLALRPIAAAPMKSIEFKDQEIRDILLVLAELGRVSIFADDTVTGRSSFYFSDMDFESAFRLFLEANALYASKRDGVYRVSRVFAEREAGTDLLSVRCVDVPLKSLIVSLSEAAGSTILFDQLPSDSITVQVDRLSLEKIVEIVAAKYRDYVVERKDNYIYIKRRDQAGQVARPPADGFFRKDGSRYSIAVDRARFRDLVLDLFRLGEKEIVFLLDQDLVLENLAYKDKSFEDMLRLLLVKAGGDFSVSDGVYYLMEVQKRDLQSKFLTTLVVTLDNISVQDLQRLLPPSLGSGTKLKVDDKDNKVVLNGTVEEITPILDFITLVDSPKTNGHTTRIDLSYLKADEAIALLPSEFSAFGPKALPSKTAFLVTLPPALTEKLRDLVDLIDRAEPVTPITLEYIKADELLASLPPSVSEQNLRKSTDPRVVFFKGTEGMRKAFMRDLAAIDRPKPQLKYQVLVLALTDTDSDDWQSGLTVTNTTSESGMSLTTGTFKDLLGIGFDVIASFGLDFGLDLQWKISRKKAQIIADTTLTSLSGEKISFKNTQTIRVKDTETVSSTTTTTTQIIREISSGLTLAIEGWISGGRMITMKIDSTLSETLDSDSESSLPETAEKVLSSTARTEIGKPLVITGLKQRQNTVDVEKVPVLGDIPLLGFLFRSRTKSIATIDYVISIIPRLEMPELDRDELERDIVEGYYRYLFGREGRAGE